MDDEHECDIQGVRSHVLSHVLGKSYLDIKKSLSDIIISIPWDAAVP